MPSTPIYGLPYAAVDDPPHGPDQEQALAEAVEDELVRVDGEITGLKTAKPYLHAYQTVTQNVQNLTPVALAFNAEFVDTINGHNTSVNNSRYTPSVPGWYECSGQVVFATTDPDGDRSAHFRRNGLRLDQAPYGGTRAPTGFVGGIAIAFASIFCNGSTDYIELWCDQNSGSTLSTLFIANLTNSFMIIKLAAP